MKEFENNYSYLNNKIQLRFTRLGENNCVYKLRISIFSRVYNFMLTCYNYEKVKSGTN